MLNTDKVKILLFEELASAQARNPHYSMRAYAKRVGIPQSAVSEILSGKRSLTQKYAHKILNAFSKSPAEVQSFYNPESENQGTYRSLDMDTYHLIADWHYFAILSLAETADFRSSGSWIAQRLGISESLAREAIERLTKLDLLQYNSKKNKLSVTGESLAIASEISKPALKKACRQNLELATEALEETDFSERDFTAITLCFDLDRMDEAKKMIKNFRRNFSKAMESKNKKEVYKLSINLFPLTKVRKKSQ